MKNLKFYVCENCDNIILSQEDREITCGEEKLEALNPIKANEEEKLSVEKIENDYYISSDHEMTKDNYIFFVAFATGDTVIMKKLFPEWNMEVRIPVIGRGILYWYSTTKGLFYQLI